MIRLNTQQLKEYRKKLRVGDSVLLTGYIYTARDAAHKKIDALLDEGKPLPFPIDGSIIYYAGPTPAKEGHVIGSCGPTTSGRMDKFAPRLIRLGLLGMIGKGERSKEVIEAVIQNECVYFCAIGGAGALAAKAVKSCEVIAFDELGCESVKRLYVEDFALIVAVDCLGNDIYQAARGASCETV